MIRLLCAAVVVYGLTVVAGVLHAARHGSSDTYAAPLGRGIVVIMWPLRAVSLTIYLLRAAYGMWQSGRRIDRQEREYAREITDGLRYRAWFPACTRCGEIHWFEAWPRVGEEPMYGKGHVNWPPREPYQPGVTPSWRLPIPVLFEDQDPPQEIRPDAQP